MFAVSDLEAGLAMRYNREVRDLTRDAQALVDAKDADIVALRRALRDTLDRLEAETAARLVAEHKLRKLNAILDMPLH